MWEAQLLFFKAVTKITSLKQTSQNFLDKDNNDDDDDDSDDDDADDDDDEDDDYYTGI